jgi:hypothetical protein
MSLQLSTSSSSSSSAVESQLLLAFTSHTINSLDSANTDETLWSLVDSCHNACLQPNNSNKKGIEGLENWPIHHLSGRECLSFCINRHLSAYNFLSKYSTRQQQQKKQPEGSTDLSNIEHVSLRQ